MLIHNPIITGSLVVSGSIVSTGGISGTAANATSASYATFASSAGSATSAISASYALYAVSASYEIIEEVSSSYAQTASYATFASSAGSATSATSATSASYATFASSAGSATSATSATSASYAVSASHVIGGVDPFPYTGTAQINGGLAVTGSVGFLQNVALPGGSWAASTALITGGGGWLQFASTGITNAALTFGGLLSGFTVGCTEEFDGTSWSVGGTMITARTSLAGAGSQNAGLAVAGAPARTCTEEYDGTSWTAGGALIRATRDNSATGTQNAGLAFGGFSAYNCTEEYNGTSWSAGGALINLAWYAGAAGTQNAGLAFGSFYTGNCTEEYDGSAWSSGGAMIVCRRYVTGTGEQTTALGFGGANPANPAVGTCTEEYNGSSWSTGGALITGGTMMDGAGNQSSGLSIAPDTVQEYTGNTGTSKTFDFSLQNGLIATGSFNGSFYGDGSNLSGVSSYIVANSANNRIITSVDDNNGNAEANLIFDGSTLTVTGSLTVTGTAVTSCLVTECLIETSAFRCKSNIQSLENGLEKVKQLKPVSFDWKSSGKSDIGFIAEDVKEVLPNLIQYNENGEVEGMNYSKITSLLVLSLQELEQKINELSNEIETLKNTK